MVMTKSGYDVNRITITNNTAKYYSDTAKEFAGQAKEFATDVVQTKSDIDNILASSGFVSVSQNIQKIVTVADNIENLGEINLDWGNLSGDINSQLDLKAKLDEKLATTEISSWAKAETKPTYTKAEIGLGNIDNTSDMDKPISISMKSALDNKANISDVYTKSEIDTKLDGIEALLEEI